MMSLEPEGFEIALEPIAKAHCSKGKFLQTLGQGLGEALVHAGEQRTKSIASSGDIFGGESQKLLEGGGACRAKLTLGASAPLPEDAIFEHGLEGAGGIKEAIEAPAQRAGLSEVKCAEQRADLGGEGRLQSFEIVEDALHPPLQKIVDATGEELDDEVAIFVFEALAREDTAARTQGLRDLALHADDHKVELVDERFSLRGGPRLGHGRLPREGVLETGDGFLMFGVTGIELRAEALQIVEPLAERALRGGDLDVGGALHKAAVDDVEQSLKSLGRRRVAGTCL